MNAHHGAPANPFIVFLIIPLYFTFLNWLISRISGWSLLARRFEATEPFVGEFWGWQSARFRWGCNYNNCLKVGASPEALYLAMPWLFQMFHPALLIPWSEIEVEKGKTLFWEYVQLRIGREEPVTVRISGKLASRLRQAAGSGWPLYKVEQMQGQWRG
jgi:hypothetical protein